MIGVLRLHAVKVNEVDVYGRVHELNGWYQDSRTSERGDRDRSTSVGLSVDVGQEEEASNAGVDGGARVATVVLRNDLHDSSAFGEYLVEVVGRFVAVQPNASLARSRFRREAIGCHSDGLFVETLNVVGGQLCNREMYL